MSTPNGSHPPTNGAYSNGVHPPSNGTHPPSKTARREAVKKTVERAVPFLEFDTTRVMTDEETAEFQRQMTARQEARKLADQEGRSGLRSRFKKACEEAERATKRLDPLPVEPTPRAAPAADEDDASDEAAAPGTASGVGRV